MFRIPEEISKPFCFENPTTNNSNKLDCNYLKSLKNQDELISLFTSAIQNENYWNAQAPEIKNKLVVLIYKMQCKKQEEGIKLDLLENAEEISPTIYAEIKQIIQDYSFRKNLKSAINLINQKSGNLLLDTSKISHLKHGASPLLPHLIAENTFLNDDPISRLIDIFNDINSNEMSIEVLPYFLKLAQECGRGPFAKSFRNSYCFFRNLLLEKICPDISINSTSSNSLTVTLIDDETELYDEVRIELKDYKTDAKKLNFILNIFDYLGWDTRIDFFYFLNDPPEFNDKKIELINKCKKHIKEVSFLTDQKEAGSKPSCQHELNNLRFLLNSGTINKIKGINFLDFLNCGNLRTLPEEIGLLKNIKILFICDKDLEDLAAIKNLTQLKYLSIRNFKHEIPQGIEELKNLKSLKLHYYLKKELEINFGQFKKLETLHLVCEQLESVPEGVWSLSELKELQIRSRTKDNFKIPFEKIISLKNLKYLDLPSSITLQERLKIFFSFSGQIQRGLFDIKRKHYPLRFLLQNPTFYLSEKKESAARLGELIMSIDSLKKDQIEDEQLLDELNQELKRLTVSLFEISEKQVTVWIEKYLNSKKLDYRMRLNHLDWFSNFLTRNSLLCNPVIDKSSYAALEALFNLTDPSLREGATRWLLSFYQPENKMQLNTWLQELPQLKKWQILPHLFLIVAGVSDSLRKSSMESLSNRYYQDSTKIKPILEILRLLVEEQQNLTKQDFENIIPLILPPLQPLRPKERGEKNFEQRKQEFVAHQKALREKQLQSINMIKNLISMKKSAYLKEVTEGNLVSRMQQACRETFGIKQENALALFNVFQSERYPSAITTYASGICTLPENEKNEFMQRLGNFIDDVIEGKFPESRYGISASDPNHLHLNTVFKMANGEINQALLEKWKSSFIIEIDSSGRSNAEPSTPPHELVKNRILQALRDSHLGPNVNTDYPSLFRLVQENLIDKNEIRSLIERAEGELSDSGLSEEKQKSLTIEIKCLKLLALDEKLLPSSIIPMIKDLEADILEGQFKQDLKDIVALLQQQSSPLKFVSIEDTNAWEDWLLMGTEVRSSCQNITGNPNYNKALLSYMTDGKYKLIMVRDANGKIAARCVLRILWDEKAQKPALYMERLYTRYMDDSLKDYIIQGCIKKAEMMGLCLVAESGDSPYQGSLRSLSSPNPYEYVDAERLGIVPTYGKYTLQKDLKLIYKPNE